jgi:hypothetical protein
MAGTFTQKNRDQLAAELGREPSAGDLYVAHFLGARGAIDLVRAAQHSPRRPAAVDFPDAAAANRAVFYDRKGRARGAGEVLCAARREPWRPGTSLGSSGLRAGSAGRLRAQRRAGAAWALPY